MKGSLQINFFVLGLFLGIAAGKAFAGSPPFWENPVKEVELEVCTDDKLQVKFLCNPDWELETEDNAMLIVISKDPVVTLTIAKAKSPVIFLEQLTKETLAEMGQYADGFTQEKAQFAGQEAVKVQGVPKEFPEIRLLDHYVLYDLILYSVLFSVNPKEKFDDYAALFNKITESFAFVEKVE